MKVNNICDLERLKSVSWSVQEDADGDCMFRPDYIAVRFTDEKDNYYEVTLHSVFWSDETARKNYSIAINELNFLFAVLGLSDGNWIGFTCSESKAVNHAREKMKNTTPEEREMWFRKKYVF